MPVRLTDLDESAPLTDGAERLERGEVLRFAPGAVPLPSDEDLEFLRRKLPSGSPGHSNSSYLPDRDRLYGLDGDSQFLERARSILAERDRVVREALGRLVPEYARDWRVGKVEYTHRETRMAESIHEQGRRPAHLGLFTQGTSHGATHGDRVLRFFTNVHPTQARVWHSAGTFADIYPHIAERLVREKATDGLRPRWLDRARSRTLRGLTGLGLSAAQRADSSPYDRAMKRLLTALESDDEFWEEPRAVLMLEFPPLSSWLVMTDVVSHAEVSGRQALVNTLFVKRARERCPAISPWAHLAGTV